MTAKDFIYFIGCDCLIFDNLENPKLGNPAIIEGVDIVADTVICERANFAPSVVKPILRPIWDMKKEEAMKIMQMVFHCKSEYPENNYHFELNENGLPKIKINNDWYEETLIIGNRGSVWSPNAHSFNVKVHSFIQLYLIEQRFDVFNYIKEDKAINLGVVHLFTYS